MTKKERIGLIGQIERQQEKLGVPYIALYLTEPERLLPSAGGGITVHQMLRMFSTAMIMAGTEFNYSPIKMLSELGDVMQEQVIKLEKSERTKKADKKRA